MCALFAWLCACQLKCFGHALANPQFHQHILAELPLLWTDDAPA
jgi:hypothetical protein